MNTTMHWTMVAGALLLAGCQQATQPAVTDTRPTGVADLLRADRIVDLSHALSATTPYWSDAPTTPFRYDILSRQPSGATSMGAYALPEHFGTHLDAPIHSADHQASVDQLTAGQLWGPAAVIDATAKCAQNPDYRLTVDDVLGWEATHGRLPDGAIVLMSTGWSRKWPDQQAYYPRDADGHMRFPGFSVEAATLLVQERSIRGIGIDDGSVDYGLSQDYAVHGIVNGAGKYHLENLADLGRLPATGAYLVVAPIKLEGGSGGQVRVYAILP